MSGRAIMRVCIVLLAFAGPACGWWDFWPYLEHQDMLDRSIDIAMSRYPDMAAEIDVYRDEMLEGTHDEDYDEDEINGSYCDYSGYCVAVPGASWPTARRPLNAIQWVHDGQNPNSWEAAVDAYRSNRASAYYQLGHVLHNLQDLFVPAHAHVAPHGLGTGGLVENHSWPGYFDNLEQYSESGERSRARADRIPELGLDSAMHQAALFAATDAESAVYYPSMYYAAPDAPGGWGRYRPYPSGGCPCGRDRVDNDLANAWSVWLVPRCCEYGAAVIRAFYLACHPTGEEECGRTGSGLTPRFSTPARPGAMLLRTAAPARVRFVSPDGRVRAIAHGTDIRCPDLAEGVWLVLVSTGDRRLTRKLVVAR